MVNLNEISFPSACDHGGVPIHHSTLTVLAIGYCTSEKILLPTACYRTHCRPIQDIRSRVSRMLFPVQHLQHLCRALWRLLRIIQVPNRK